MVSRRCCTVIVCIGSAAQHHTSHFEMFIQARYKAAFRILIITASYIKLFVTSKLHEPFKTLNKIGSC